MVDKSSQTHTATCTNTSTTLTTLRSAINAVANYRGTTYMYPQRAIIPLIAQCLEDLGFSVATSVSNYYNHIALNDYSTDIVLQMYNSAASTNCLSFLFPRNSSNAITLSAIFNSNTACRASIRMLGNGVGQIRTVLLLGSDNTPSLSCNFAIYFTTAKYLPTGEEKKATVIANASSVLFYLYDDNWGFLPGFSSDLTTFASGNNWQALYPNYINRSDPFSNYYLLRGNDFPIIPAVSSNGLWEFPDIIVEPYGFLSEDSVAESYKYPLTSGVIYQIGKGKYLNNVADVYKGNRFLLRVE